MPPMSPVQVDEPHDLCSSFAGVHPPGCRVSLLPLSEDDDLASPCDSLSRRESVDGPYAQEAEIEADMFGAGDSIVKVQEPPSHSAQACATRRARRQPHASVRSHGISSADTAPAIEGGRHHHDATFSWRTRTAARDAR